MKNKKRCNLAIGGRVTNHIDNPLEVLQEYRYDIDEAKYLAASDPAVLALQGLAAVAPQIVSAFSPQLKNLAGGDTTNMAQGGTVGQGERKITAEGGELLQTSKGELLKLKGPRHEKGGIDLDIPEPGPGEKEAIVYSDRIKRGGKSIAKLKEQRAKEINKYLDLYAKSGDISYLNTAKRLEKSNILQDVKDVELMENMRALTGPMEFNSPEAQEKKGEYSEEGNPSENGEERELAAQGLEEENPMLKYILATNPITMGGGVVPVVESAGKSGGGNTSSLSQAQSSTGQVFSKGSTAGEIIGSLGNMFSAVAPLVHTMKSRATDMPEVNVFKDFGKESLERLNNVGVGLKQQYDNAKNDIRLNTLQAIRNTQGSFRGINSKLATMLGIYQNANNSQIDLNSKYADQVANHNKMVADTMLNVDNIRLKGEDTRLEREAQNKDAYDTAINRQLGGIGEAIALMGQTLTGAKNRQAMASAISGQSKYFAVDAMGNKIPVSMVDVANGNIPAGTTNIIVGDGSGNTIPTEQDKKLISDLKNGKGGNTTQIEVNGNLPSQGPGEENVEPTLTTSQEYDIPGNPMTPFGEFISYPISPEFATEEPHRSAIPPVSLKGTGNLNTVKESIARTETNGAKNSYSMRNSEGSGALGKYQIVYKWHKDDIKKITGAKSPEEFLNSPKAQEDYMDYLTKQNMKLVDKHIDKIISKFPTLDYNKLVMLAHYQPSIITDLASGKIDSLDYVPGGGRYTNKSIGYYVDKNYKGKKTNKK